MGIKYPNMSESIYDPDYKDDTDFDKVLMFFKIVTIFYIPLILISNTLVFWATILCANFHTPINVILFSLCIADLFTGLVNLPFYYYMERSSGVVPTKNVCLSFFAVRYITFGGTLVHLLFIALDRYVAVIWPRKYRSLATVKRAIVLVIFIWIYILLIAFLPMTGHNTYDSNKKDGSACDYFEALPKSYALYATVISTCVCLFIPGILFIHIFIAFNKQMKEFQEQYRMMKTEEIIQFKLESANMKITIVLMAMFFILWTPAMFVSALKYSNLLSQKGVKTMNIFGRFFVITNALVNAPLYALGRHDYKQAYWLMLTNPPWKWKRELSDLHYRGTSFTMTAASLARYTDYRGIEAIEKTLREKPSLVLSEEKRSPADNNAATSV